MAHALHGIDLMKSVPEYGGVSTGIVILVLGGFVTCESSRDE